MKKNLFIFGLLGCMTLHLAQGAEKMIPTTLGFFESSSFKKGFTTQSINPGMRALIATSYQSSAHFNRPALLAICAPMPHQTTVPTPKLLNPAAAAAQQTDTLFQEHEEHYELIPEQFSTIGSIVSKTLTALESEQTDNAALEQLQESWTTLGSFVKLSYESFTSDLKNNFDRKITPLLNEDYTNAPSCLGFTLHDSLTSESAKEKFTFLTRALDLLKNLEKNPKSTEEISAARTLIQKHLTCACATGFVKAESFASLDSLENVVQFVEEVEPFFGIVRQTYFLLREPLGLDVFKNYCQGKEVLEEKVNDYKKALDHYKINPSLTGTVMSALVYKKAAGELESQDRVKVLAALNGCLQ